MRPAGGEDPRVLIAQGDDDVRVALIVLEGGVKARTIALYEVRFEYERLHLALRSYKIYLSYALA